MTKIFKICMLVTGISYTVIAYFGLMNIHNYNWNIYYHVVLGVGVSIIWILFLTHVPKFCLRLLHDYIKKVINE